MDLVDEIFLSKNPEVPGFYVKNNLAPSLNMLQAWHKYQGMIRHILRVSQLGSSMILVVMQTYHMFTLVSGEMIFFRYFLAS